MKSPFFNAQYIMAQSGTPEPLFTDTPAPLFRRKFKLADCKNARLSVVGLGYARFYLNGKEITEDKFISPVSDYTKNVWYNTYDVTDLLCEGENVAAVICGNGFFNEGLETSWHHNLAQWRDYPKFLFCLTVDGVPALVSDESWRCTTDSFIPFNQLRSGEHYDARLFDPSWNGVAYDDSAWKHALVDDNPPTGVLMECPCEPIRELEVLTPTRIFQLGDSYVVDFGKNMAGYAQITVSQSAGDRIVLKYAEEYLEEEGRLDNGQMETIYKGFPFQIDELICSGGTDTYKPYFTYHGFRYIEIQGLKEAPTAETICAFFVHQDLKRKSSFDSSDEILNYIYRAGIRSTYSNMHYALTDCPTREKLGWTNDAQATTEQTLINFNSLDFYRKWYTDILFSMKEDGSIPGIVPSPGWGLDCGPVCDCLLYELPYRVYLYTGDPSMLIEGLEHFKRYIACCEQRKKDNTYLWLADWTGHGNSPLIPQPFVLDFYFIKSLRVTLLAEKLAGGNEVEALQAKLDQCQTAFLNDYLDAEGYSTIEEQTALSMQICFGLYRDFNKLKEQLERTIVRDEFRLTCGMVGVQYLYEALSLCGLQDFAHKIITESNPGYRLWYEYGATTLWERWDGVQIHSHNHHMFSNILGWFYTGLLGIYPNESAPGFEKIELRPCFVSNMDFCEGYEDTVRGRIEARWEKQDDAFVYTVTLPKNVQAVYAGYTLVFGENRFRIMNETITKI